MLIISLVFIGNITLISSLRENNAFAYSYFNENSLTLSNNTFSSYGSSKEKGLPYSLSGYNWTIKNDANVLAGVINVDEETFYCSGKVCVKQGYLEILKPISKNTKKQETEIQETMDLEKQKLRTARKHDDSLQVIPGSGRLLKRNKQENLQHNRRLIYRRI